MRSSLVALCGLALAACQDRPISESALRDRFSAHPSEFQALAEMAAADSGLSRIAPTYTWAWSDKRWPRADPGLTATRWNEYRRLFAELKIAEGLDKDRGGQLALIVQTSGILGRGWEEGYVYAPGREDPPTLPALPRPEQSRNGTWYVRLKGDWYLYLRRD